MSEIEKYKKYLRFKANPRYLRRDFIVPLYTGTEPDIVPETSVEQQGAVQEFNDGGRVERQGYSFAGLVKETKNKLINESNPQKKFQLKKRLNFLEDLQKKSKSIQGAKSIENLVLKKDKLGRPFFSDYLEKLNALEDLQNNKYLNPKTNKTFTPQEWLKASPSYRGKFRDPETFLEKKKEYQKKYMKQRKESDPEYKQKFLEKKKEEYYSKERANRNVTKEVVPGKGVLREQRNKLLSYMSEAAKDNPNYKDIIKEGKFIGVFDKENKINYYEAGYKGKLGKNSKLITEHPDYNDVNNLAKLADRFKRELPNKAIASYFSAYERVPTMSEMYNFLQSDPRFVEKMSPKFFQTNALHLHHQASLTESPSQKIQLLLQDRNDQAGKKLIEFQKGNITEEQLNKDLKKLNTRYYVDGKSLGAIETSPETQLRTAKSQTTRLFNKRLKENPELVEQMTKRLNINSTQMIAAIGCEQKVKAMGLGGRVNFSEGSNCYAKGLEKIKSGELTPGERMIAGNFLKEAGLDTKTISFIKNAKNLGSFLFDLSIGKTPAAALVNFGINVPFAIAEAQEGKPGRQVLGTATNVIGLGPLVGTTEESEITKAMGADAPLYFKIKEAYDRYQDAPNKLQRLENSRLELSGFRSPEETPSDIVEKEIQLEEKKIKKQDEEDEKFLDPFIDKKGNLKFPKNIEKGLQILKDQEELRKARNILEMKNIPSVGEDILPTDNISFEKSNENINKKIEELESKKPLYGSEIDKNITPELMDVIYESGARGGAAEGGYIDYIRDYNKYARGGRIHLSEGGKGPKLSRRGFLGFLAGAAASPFVIKGMKGKKFLQGAKVATKILPKVSGMPEWFTPLVNKIMKEGVDISPKATRVEDIVKVKKLEVPVPGEKKPDIITMYEYPDGRIEISANVYGGSYDSPFDLIYKPPKSDVDLETGKQIIEPGEFSVMENRPRPVYSPDDADFEIDYEKMNVEDAISDIERIERIATGKRIHPKRVEQREKARAFVEDNPYDDIINRYGDAGDIEFDRMKDEGLLDD